MNYIKLEQFTAEISYDANMHYYIGMCPVGDTKLVFIFNDLSEAYPTFKKELGDWAVNVLIQPFCNVFNDLFLGGLHGIMEGLAGTGPHEAPDAAKGTE